MAALTLAAHEAEMPNCKDPDCEFHHSTCFNCGYKISYIDGIWLDIPWDEAYCWPHTEPRTTHTPRYSTR